MTPRRILLVILGVAGLAAPASFAEAPVDASAARAVVEQTLEDVIATLRRSDLPVSERQSRIEHVALERFDLTTMSRLVLGKGWRLLSRDQHEEFVTLFTDHLSAGYGARIERYDQESVVVLGERVEPRGDVTIKTKIEGGSADGVAVDYRLRKRKGETEWRIINVTIAGVSLVSNFRSQIAAVLSREGPEELLARFREISSRELPSCCRGS